MADVEYGPHFVWDAVKAAQNLRKHRVSFPEATEVFLDAEGRVAFDAAHSESEDRWAILGESNRGRLLMVVFVDVGDRIRIISAWRATKRESNEYYQQAVKTDSSDE